MNFLVNLILCIVMLGLSGRGVGSDSKPLTRAELADHLKLYRRVKELKAKFQQTKTLKSIDLELKSKGTLQWTRPDKVYWKIHSPSFLEVRLEKKQIQITSGENENREVQKFSLGKEAPGARSLSQLVAWLRLDVESLFRTYEIFELKPRQFLCKPREPDKAAFLSLEMFLHSKGHMKKIIISEKSGDTIKIVFSQPSMTFGS